MNHPAIIQEVYDNISMGFCQPKFYKPSAWNKAKKIMQELCKIEENGNKLVIPFDYGRGKGKYTTTEYFESKYGKKDCPNMELAEIYCSRMNLIPNPYITTIQDAPVQISLF